MTVSAACISPYYVYLEVKSDNKPVLTSQRLLRNRGVPRIYSFIILSTLNYSISVLLKHLQNVSKLA